MEQIKSIIKKYIEDNIKVSSRPSENLKSLTKITNYFSDLLRSTQDNITYELIDEILLENDVVNALLASIMNKYLPYIEENSLEELFADEITCQVVEIYCDKNNIDINKLDLSESTSQSVEGYVGESQSVEGYVGESQTMFFNEIRQYRLLTPEETRDLIIKAQNGNMTARDDLINHNIRLVISIAKKFKLQNNKITTNDLIQEGVFGLNKAIEKFDVSRGYKFSTYATWWIKQTIKKYLNASVSNFKYSTYTFANLRKIDKATKQIQEETGHDPSISELSKKTCLTMRQIIDLQTLVKTGISLDDPIKVEDPDIKIIDLISDPNAEIEETYISEDFNEEIITCLFNSRLSERERQIIIYRFGLLGHRKRTLEEIGEMFNVTRERIRQQEAKALRILQNDPAFKTLKNIADGNLEDNTKVSFYQVKSTYRLTKYFPAYSTSDLRLAINTLDKTSQNLIKKYYYDDYSPKKEIQISENDHLRLIRLIFRILPITLRKVSVKHPKELVNGEEGLFSEIPEIPKYIIINTIFNCLPSEDKTLLRKAYGVKFNENHTQELKEIEKEMLQTHLIPYLRGESLNVYNSLPTQKYTRQDIPILDLVGLPSFIKLNPIIGPELIILIALKTLNNEELFADYNPIKYPAHQSLTPEEKSLISANKDLVADFIIEFQELIPKIKQNKSKSIN